MTKKRPADARDKSIRFSADEQLFIAITTYAARTKRSFSSSIRELARRGLKGTKEASLVDQNRD